MNFQYPNAQLPNPINTKETNHVQDLYENGKDTMNFAEMSIKRPRSEYTATHTPILGIRNRGVF